MITIRRSSDRGQADYGWLKPKYTFSFARYYDPAHMGFSDLRVINEDIVAPGRGFDTHEHDNMEILTVVLEGELAHRDSLGHVQTIKPGEVQRMTAGSGIAHSEFNASKTEPVHLLQIWLMPAKENTEPGYEQKNFPLSERADRLRLLASPDAAEGSLAIGQNTRLFGSALGARKSVEHALAPGRAAWLQITRGAVDVNGTRLSQGDGASITDEDSLKITAVEPAEFLLFDLRSP